MLLTSEERPGFLACLGACHCTTPFFCAPIVLGMSYSPGPTVSFLTPVCIFSAFLYLMSSPFSSS